MKDGLSKLEIWLVRAIRAGSLRDLPPYYRLGEPEGRHPERYARMLLAGLKGGSGNGQGRERDRERALDDGRAFRSWAESRPVELGRSDRLETAC